MSPSGAAVIAGPGGNVRTDLGRGRGYNTGYLRENNNTRARRKQAVENGSFPAKMRDLTGM